MKNSNSFYIYEPRAKRLRKSASTLAGTHQASAGTARVSVAKYDASPASRGGATDAVDCNCAKSASPARHVASRKTTPPSKTGKAQSSGTSKLQASTPGVVIIGDISMSLEDYGSVPSWIWGRYLLNTYTVNDFKVNGRPVNNLEMQAVISAYQKLKEVRNDIRHWTQTANGETEENQNAGVWQRGHR